MNFKKLSIRDIVLIESNVIYDNRGYFFEVYRQNLLEEEIGYKVNFVQDNQSRSEKGSLRGLHYQIPPYSQAKLIRVTEGKVLDVILDIRRSSKTFGKYLSIELSEKNQYQLFIPHGFAHGFITLSDYATIVYKVDNYYLPNHERGIAFDDNDLQIDWRFSKEKIKLSLSDKKHPTLDKSIDLFE